MHQFNANNTLMDHLHIYSESHDITLPWYTMTIPPAIVHIVNLFWGKARSTWCCWHYNSIASTSKLRRYEMPPRFAPDFMNFLFISRQDKEGIKWKCILQTRQSKFRKFRNKNMSNVVQTWQQQQKLTPSKKYLLMRTSKLLAPSQLVVGRGLWWWWKGGGDNENKTKLI